MRLIILVLSFTLASNIMAQKKLLVDFNIGILNPIGTNNLKDYYSTINPVSIQYYSRKKLEHISVNLIGEIAYPVTKKLAIGIESGICMRFLEQYTTNTKRTSILIPLALTAKYNLFKIDNKYFALNIASGLLLFDFTDAIERYHNSTFYNAALSYALSKKGLIKLGIEKQIDNVSFDIKKGFPNYKYEIFDYKINRLFINLSYSIKIQQ